MKNLLYVLKPKFIFVILLYRYLLGMSFIIIPILLIGIYDMITHDVSLKMVFNIYFLYALLVFASIPLVNIYFIYLNYKATIYKVFDDSIEFDEGFFNHSHTALKFTDIKEIHYYQDFVQRIFNIGTVVFYTAANATSKTGIRFLDILNPSDIYNKVKMALDKNNGTR